MVDRSDQPLSPDELAQHDIAPITARPSPLRGAFGGLLLFALVFAYGAWSWVQFFLLPDSAGGNHVVLFTQTDFPAVVIASRQVASGQGGSLYDLGAQLEGQQQLTREGELALGPQDNRDLKYPYPYAPFIALLWSPLSGLPPRAQMALWDLVNLALMCTGLWYLLSTLPLRPHHRLMLMLGGLTCLPFIINLQQGQSSGLVLFSWAVGLAMLRRGRDFTAGVAFGLLALKVQWLPFLLLVLLWKRRWRTLLGMLAVGLGLLVLAVAVMGTGWIPDYLDVIVKAQQGAREFLLDPLYSHSLTGGLVALLGPGAESAARLVNLGAIVALAGALLFLWRGRWSPGTAEWDGLAAVTFLAAIVTNGHLNTHDLCLLVLPAALGTAFVANRNLTPSGERTLWPYLLWATYVILALPPGTTLALSLRLTTLVMVLLLVYLLGAVQPTRVRVEAGNLTASR
ncbi:MAG TPA: glycosyltransferase family 87 protein [Chloroflexia bacterium]|nr:glycosyltransferase family 87 protein [Chloroflexia bacterium]